MDEEGKLSRAQDNFSNPLSFPPRHGGLFRVSSVHTRNHFVQFRWPLDGATDIDGTAGRHRKISAIRGRGWSFFFVFTPRTPFECLKRCLECKPFFVARKNFWSFACSLLFCFGILHLSYSEVRTLDEAVSRSRHSPKVFPSFKFSEFQISRVSNFPFQKNPLV